MSHSPVPSAAPGHNATRATHAGWTTGVVVGGMQRMLRRGARQVGAQAALVWLLLALVVAPTLGRLHEVTHGTTLDRAHAGQVLLAQRQAQRAKAIDPALSQGLKTANGDLSPTTPTRADATATPAGDSPSSPGLFGRLAGHHSAADCLLLDQLALGDALYSVPLVVPAPVLAQAPPAPPAGRVGVLHVALFQARGPPLASKRFFAVFNAGLKARST